MPAKAKPTPLTLEEKLEVCGQKVAHFKRALTAIERDASAAGFPMEPVQLLMGRLAKPRLPRPRVFRSSGQLELEFMALLPVR